MGYSKHKKYWGSLTLVYLEDRKTYAKNCIDRKKCTDPKKASSISLFVPVSTWRVTLELRAETYVGHISLTWLPKCPLLLTYKATPHPSGRQWRVDWGRFREEINLLLLLQAGFETQFLVSATYSYSHHNNYPCLCQFCVFHLGVSLVQLHINRGWCLSQPSKRRIFRICLSIQFNTALSLVVLAPIKAMSLSFSTTLQE